MNTNADTARPLENILSRVSLEVTAACAKHPKPYNSPHEGWAVIKEEVDELWEHVRSDTGRTPAAGKEAIHIAVTAVRYVMSLTDPAEAHSGDYEYTIVGVHTDGYTIVDHASGEDRGAAVRKFLNRHGSDTLICAVFNGAILEARQ